MNLALRFDRAGDRPGPPVVLLHSVGLDRTFWAPVAASLSRRWTTFCVDLRGHGESPAPAGPWRLEHLADDVADLLAGQCVARAHVVGQSFGGLVAQHVAIRHPDLVETLVLSGTSCTTSPAEREVFLERARAAETQGMSAVAEAAIRRWFTDAGTAEPIVARTRERLLSDDPRKWAKTFRAIAEHNVLNELRQVYARTLVVTGDADIATPPRFAHDLADALPNAQLLILEGVPHMAYLEKPKLFALTLERFLAGEPAPSGTMNGELRAAAALPAPPAGEHLGCFD